MNKNPDLSNIRFLLDYLESFLLFPRGFIALDFSTTLKTWQRFYLAKSFNGEVCYWQDDGPSLANVTENLSQSNRLARVFQVQLSNELHLARTSQLLLLLEENSMSCRREVFTAIARFLGCKKKRKSFVVMSLAALNPCHRYFECIVFRFRFRGKSHRTRCNAKHIGENSDSRKKLKT